MIVGVAGPYSALSAEQRKQNLDAMNIAAAKVFEKGHIPFIGINVAVPIVNQMTFENEEKRYEAIMQISLILIDQYDALLVIGESKGVQMEKNLIISKELQVYYSLEEVPEHVQT